VGIMGMTRAVWVGQARVWVGHGLPGLISRTASAFSFDFVSLRRSGLSARVPESQKQKWSFFTVWHRII